MMLARSLLFNVVLFLSVAVWSVVVVVGRLWGYAVACQWIYAHQ